MANDAAVPQAFGASSPALLERSGAITIDGLTAFAPIWAAAMMFSVAGDRHVLLLKAGVLQFALGWAAFAAAALLMVRPRAIWLLLVLAGLMAVRYASNLPVASNNKTMSFFMNSAMLAISAQALVSGLRGADFRVLTYERIRIVARGLLAVMYFYGIFHKINTDFLDPRVSCAVALYTPLSAGFGLGDNLYGKYLAIGATFVIETITLVTLYWRRYFAVGLFFGLAFHFVIPISAYSWYMDFSSLVLALYVLAIPREATEKFYETFARGFRALRARYGEMGVLLPFAVVLGGAVALSVILSLSYPGRQGSHVHHSIWMLLWAVYGGVTMVALAHAALDHLPWQGRSSPRQPWWIYAFPGTLFLSCLSPYLGLKTESSIAMFSNLHTEAGVTNHLLFAKPPYLFDYQQDVVEVVASSDKRIQDLAAKNQSMVFFAVKEFLRKHPEHWISYRRDGVLHERMRVASFAPEDHANRLERTFLLFKPVDFARPKVCTH